MSTGRSKPPQRVPTLTEVVEIPAAAAPRDEPPIPVGETIHAPVTEADVATLVAAQSAAVPQLDEEQLTQRVLGELQRQVDVLLEQRLRESLTPALARLTDSLVREMRVELASTLRELVARAVTQELSRHRRR
ncbi:hypothetical protein [Piscinibacter sp.]|jgi:hypothetical protein|uniref:hypothetical protein n=1 Tax=Piscinibacter sp. TaxID=1903157 RepID=UPI002F42BB89